MSLEELCDKVVKILEVEPHVILNNCARNHVFGRNVLIHLIANNPRYSMVEKGKFFGVSGDAISKSNKRFIDRLKKNNDLRKRVDKMKSLIDELD